MSAAKVRNLEIMFHTRTTKRAAGLIRICNRFASECRRAATSGKRSALAVLKAAKLSKRRKSQKQNLVYQLPNARVFIRRLVFLLSEEREFILTLHSQPQQYNQSRPARHAADAPPAPSPAPVCFR